jgi:glycosyltransferase involved in cell wall biosynthesis
MNRIFARKILHARDYIWTAVSSLSANLDMRFGKHALPSLYYIIPEAGWVTDWVGRYITDEIRHKYKWNAHLTSTPEMVSGQIIHYGEMGSFLNSLNLACNHKNIIISTIFHGVRDSKFPELAIQTERFLSNSHIPVRIVTACKLMETRLQSWGIPDHKIVRIPLGINLKQFFPAQARDREQVLLELGIPRGLICIGSFQKDGIGWGEGLEPKIIKGPDIFLEVVRRLKSQFPIFVLLSGPARGYMKNGLEKMGIPYRHILVNNYQEMRRLYHALDLYLVTSREEGGPLAVLECLATGTPIVSTKVGLAPDLIKHAWNGFLADIEDIDGLVENTACLIESKDIKRNFIENELQSIQPFDWSFIASRYYEEIYFPILQAL